MQRRLEASFSTTVAGVAIDPDRRSAWVRHVRPDEPGQNTMYEHVIMSLF